MNWPLTATLLQSNFKASSSAFATGVVSVVSVVSVEKMGRN